MFKKFSDIEDISKTQIKILMKTKYLKTQTFNVRNKSKIKNLKCNNFFAFSGYCEMTFSESHEIRHFLSHIVTNKIWEKSSRKKSVNLKVICIGALLSISYRLWLSGGKSKIFVSLPWKSVKHSLPSDTERWVQV